jgi:hypothetical protein
MKNLNLKLGECLIHKEPLEIKKLLITDKNTQELFGITMMNYCPLCDKYHYGNKMINEHKAVLNSLEQLYNRNYSEKDLEIKRLN